MFDELNIYEATLHFNGQSSTELDGDHASGVTYCLAHHVTVDGPARNLMIAAIRYLDTFVRQDGTWFFSQRNSWSIGQKPAPWQPDNPPPQRKNSP